jgi:tetratricopeptide (TPR) repeat protein/DNA-binding winged helix-turn-helix (wHTH) protein/TolB-like protein
MVTSFASPITGYCFAGFRLDLIRGCLTCTGDEVPLRYQSFQLLRYFVEHPGIVISKDALATAIWNDTSVTDNALVQCIVDIRRALDDDPHHPRFIKTSPKVGYRFIATVEVATDESASPNDIDAPSSSAQPIPQRPRGDTPLRQQKSPSAKSALPAVRSNGLGRFVAQMCLTVLILVLHGDIAPDRGPAIAAAPPVAGPPILAVFPLGNETGRQDLDWLREGMSDMILTNLAHTGQWNILSREKMHALLDDGTSPGAASLGRMVEAARSVHARDFIAGTVSMDGQHIAIRVDTRDGRDGHLLATDTTSLDDHRQIVAQADLLSSEISRHLGFSADATPSLGDVMTSNVEAYRYYSLGVEKAEQFQNTQSIELFEKAIKADPRFAMAYARIGYAYAVQDFQPEKARPYLDRALHFSDHLPAINRLYIEAWSAIARSDYNAAVGILRQITNQYPDETEAFCQLSRILRGQERVDEAAELLRNAIHKNPNAKDLYNAFGMILVSMRRSQDAIDAYKQYVALAPENPNAHDSLGMSYQMAGQYEASLPEYDKALQLDPEFEPSIVHLGDIYYQEGRYRDALREYRRYIQVVRSSDAKAIGYGDLATVYRTMGNLKDAQIAATEEVRNNRNAVWDSLVINLDRNLKDRARALQATIFASPPSSERGSPRNLRMEFFYRGYIELKTGDSQGAISHFKLALKHLPPSSGIDLHEDCLANAYLDLGMIPNAIAEYQRILKINPNYPLAHYHLGLSYQNIHDRKNAIAAFQRFLQINPLADQDSPPVMEARRGIQGDIS